VAEICAVLDWLDSTVGVCARSASSTLHPSFGSVWGEFGFAVAEIWAMVNTPFADAVLAFSAVPVGSGHCDILAIEIGGDDVERLER